MKFLDVDEEAGKLVVSQKRAAMEGATFDLKRGAVVSGTITGTFALQSNRFTAVQFISLRYNINITLFVHNDYLSHHVHL